jgi:NAD+ kinase
VRTVSAEARIACVASGSTRSRVALAELEYRYPLVAPEDCDALVVLGGDGFLLHAMHDYLQLRRPIFGMNRGTVGFLLNEYRPDGLLERIAAAVRICVHPVAMTATGTDGSVVQALAFNEVSVTRHSAQTANIRVSVDGVERLSAYMGDGLIVSTAAGSTAYNLSAHGPIIPLGSDLLGLTPVSPFRPRRWRGALLPADAKIELRNLDPVKRPLVATADFIELFDVESATIVEDRSIAVELLFDPDHSLEDRIIAEQFLT